MPVYRRVENDVQSLAMPVQRWFHPGRKERVRGQGRRQPASGVHTTSIYLLLDSAGLCSGELRHHRGKVLHLSFIDLEVGETVTITLLKEVCNRLLHTEWSFWNGRPS